MKAVTVDLATLHPKQRHCGKCGATPGTGCRSRNGNVINEYSKIHKVRKAGYVPVRGRPKSALRIAYEQFACERCGARPGQDCTPVVSHGKAVHQSRRLQLAAAQKPRRGRPAVGRVR